MIDVKPEYKRLLESVGLTMQEMVVLCGELLDDEHIILDEIVDDKKYIYGVMRELNKRKRLPKKYENFVSKWNGFDGVGLDFDILI